MLAEDGAPEAPEADDFDPTAAFFSDLTGGKKLDDHEAAEDSAEPSSKAAEDATSDDPDDAEVEWGEETSRLKAKMRDLKAAFAERDVSAKSATAAATLRDRATQDAARAQAALSHMARKAQDAYEPYAKADWLALMRDLPADQFDALRSDAAEKLKDYQFFTAELDGVVQTNQQKAHETSQAAAKAAMAELTDPVKGIPGFGRELWDKLVAHAVSVGAPRAAVEGITDPWAVRLIHDAMLYRQGATGVTEKVAKVVNKPTRTATPTTKGSPDKEVDGRRSALAKLRGGSSTMDDIADAFYADLHR